jgi:cell division protein FtsI/penicillin-binding protein 2
VARRRRLLRHGLPALIALAVAVLAVVLLVGGAPGRAERDTARRFATLWARGDYTGMYALLGDDARRRVSPSAFEDAYRAAARTATLRSLAAGDVGKRHGDAIPVAMTVATRAFGTFRAVLELPVRGSGDGMRIAWTPQAVFPGLRAGERLSRVTTLPPRAALLARDGTVLARGATRSSQAPDVAAEIVGRLGPAPPEQQDAMQALGYPAEAPVGLSGLERAFQEALAGHPGGTLYAGGRALAHRAPRAGATVRTTIDPAVERAAITALGGRYGGVAAIAPRTGEVLALAGVAFSALQPPGSTFKIVTLTGVLESHLAKPGSPFPYETSAPVGGVPIQNANGESCGGTLVQAFASSCNSVFAPLGAQLGARRLVDVAQRYGFNEPPAIRGAAESTIPAADAIGDTLAVGSSAIGQGRVQASTLEMTDVAAAIAMGGRRPEPTLRLGARPRFVRVTRPAVAREVAQMMGAVVRFGTGTAAAIPGVAVAGKTGTAELRDTVPTPQEELAATQQQQDQQDRGPGTDAWFVGYAPADRPRIVAGALFANAGAGGDVAAPAVRQVLVAALKRR